MADVKGLVGELTLEEKASLTAGEDLWSTVAVDRVGIPKVRVTDGPNGARGANLPGGGGATSVCIPCGSALGATWDVELLRRVGVLLGRETRRRGCRVLLAPTVNIHRSPLAGRNFECYSEDPLLSGSLAAAYIRGVQSQDVATTVKHYVANDAEFERMSMSSVVDERTLREIYLVPFEMAVRDGGSLGLMTSYNRLNGTWCGEDPELYSILRDEWGFEGFVVSDWYAATSTASALAGMDLEMPGPGRAMGAALVAAVKAGDLDESVLDAQVIRLLSVFDRLGALDDPGDGTATSVDLEEDRSLAREASAASIVLLKNDDVLPLDPGLRSLAVIGPNADRAVIMGGGSAHVTPAYRTTPLEALRNALPGVDITYAPGVGIDRKVPTLPITMQVEYFAGSDIDTPGERIHQTEQPTAEFFSLGPPSHVTEPFTMRATGTFTPDTGGPYVFSLVQAGRARVSVDGRVVIDGVADPMARDRNAYFGFGSEQRTALVDLEADRPVEIVVEYTSRGAGGAYAARVGARLEVPRDAMDIAIAAARDADAAVVVVGTTDEWESEGFDRSSLQLPGDQDHLIERIAAANRNTIVVVNTGAPVEMSWVDAVPAVLQLWFGGQEMANALADVLTGEREPGGRLPTTIPLRLEHNPSYGNFPGEHDEVRYGEGLLVGYRWYDARHLPVRFPFGHGLSYSSFEIGEPVPSTTHVASGDVVTIDVPVTNTGTRAGSEVVQCYVAAPSGRITRPPKELKAFAKTHLEPGESTTVRLTLTERAFAVWDPGSGQRAELKARLPFSDMTAPARTRERGWRVHAGTYVARIGRSSAELVHAVHLQVDASD